MSDFVHWPDEYYFQLAGKMLGRPLDESEKLIYRNDLIPDFEKRRKALHDGSFFVGFDFGETKQWEPISFRHRYAWSVTTGTRKPGYLWNIDGA